MQGQTNPATGSVSGEHRPPACSIRQPAECMSANGMREQSRFAASCRELQASGLCSPDLYRMRLALLVHRCR